jgi:hypothetical protein
VIARAVLVEFGGSAVEALSAEFFEHPPKSEAMMTKNAQICAVAGCLIESMYELQYANPNRAICRRLVTDMSAIKDGLTYNRKCDRRTPEAVRDVLHALIRNASGGRGKISLCQLPRT